MKKAASFAFLTLLMYACQDRVISAFPDEYAGVGVELKIGNDRLPHIVKVFNDGGAQEAGIEAGDKVFSVDGKKTRGKELAQIVSMLRGPQGSAVMVEIISQGGKKKRIPVARKKIMAIGEKKYKATN